MTFDPSDVRGAEGLTDARPRPRYVPAILDAIIPGLGHLIAGRRGRAALFFAPIGLALVAVGVVVITTPGPRLLGMLAQDDVLWALLIVQGLLLAWRLLAVGSSLTGPGTRRLSARDALPVVAVLALTIAPQAYAGYATNVSRETLDQMFVTPPPVAAIPSGSAAPDPSFLTAPSASPSGSASASPSATPPAVQRINALIVGVDSGVGRSTYATDTMIIASLDPVDLTVSLLSVPRDMVDVPLADGRIYKDKINGLVAYARNHPAQFPGSDGTGFDILRGALGKLVGLDIPYYAVVNLGGFVQVVNTLGGVDVNVAHGFCDPTYKQYGYANGFSITAGRHHLNGLQALAYARVRKASGESDFTRAARQQEILSGIREAIERGGFLNDPIGLIKDLGQTVQTNLPRSMLPDLAQDASEITRPKTYRAVITHPLVKPGFDVRGSIQLPVLGAIKALAAKLFPVDGSLPDVSLQVPDSTTKRATTSGVGNCAPAATPTPKPTAPPKSSAPPSPTPSDVSSAIPSASPSEAGSS